MSRQGMTAALRYGEDLPAFSSLAEAEENLLQLKESTLDAFLAEHGSSIGLDFSPESLKSLENWYFEAGHPKAGAGNYAMPLAIGFYFGEVLCRSAGFVWTVEEYPFVRGRYEVGVRRRLAAIMLTKGKAPPAEGNARRQRMWREYKNWR